MSWRQWYANLAFLVDAGVATSAALATAFLAPVPPLVAASVVAWPLACALTGTYNSAILGVGMAEARRIVRAAAGVLLGLGAVSYVVGAPIARGTVLFALPILALGSVLGRFATRAALSRRTADGEVSRRVLLVGEEAQIRRAAARLSRTRHLGTIVAGLTPEQGAEDLLLTEGVPLLSGLDRIPTAIDLVEADTVLVAAGTLSALKLRELGWQLEATGVELAVLPGLTDVESHRLSLHVIDGLPMLSVGAPLRRGASIALKHVLDRALAGLLLVSVAPLFLAVAAAVRFGSPGPAVFRQERVGQNGKTFTLYKFRTMVSDAESQRELLVAGNDADGPLFKLREDPRVTRVGRFLRKHSLDELPQLLNVVKGEMSLVGPRPPLPVEVAAYSSDVRRRLLVRPGLTGLWQVSGRSDLSWDDSVRLDLRYVDNVSLTGDASILGRTVRTVLKGNGAY